MSFKFFQRSLCTVSKLASASTLLNMQAAAAHGSCAGLQHSRLRCSPFTRLGQCQYATRNRNRPSAGAAAVQATAAGPQGPLDLETVLGRVRQAVHGSHPLWQALGNKNAQVFGEGVHMGLPVAWAFMWRPDGAYYEEVRSQHLTYKWGYDGAGNCWEVDPYGVSKVLEKDDHESSLLGALIRSGNWLVPELAAQHLDIQLEDTAASNSGQSSLPLAMPPVAATWDVEPCPYTAAAAAASAAGPVAAACSTHSHPHHHHEQQQQQLWQHPTTSSSSSSAVVASAAAPVEALPESVGGVAEEGSRRRRKDVESVVYVTLRSKNGRMVTRIQISASTWLPVSYRQPFCSDIEAWVFNDWNNWTLAQRQQQQRHAGWSNGNGAGIADVLFPRRVTHVLCKEVANTYITRGGITRGAEVHTAYQIPVSPPVPCDVQYLETVSPQVPAWQTFQGHLLIQAHLNGRQAGWMLLDTGASGFVVEPRIADRYKLPAFGDLSIAGIAGKIPTRFRRASQLRLGPVVLSDPVMLEMSIQNIVGVFHEEVIGIVGYDVFKRCRITIPCHNTRKTIQKATLRAGRVKVYNPDKDTPAAAKQAAHPWPPTAADQQRLAAVTQLQQGLAAAASAAGNGIGHAIGQAAAAVTGRSRRRSSTTSSSSSSSTAVVGKRRRVRFSVARAVAATAAATSTSAAVIDRQQQEQQEQQEQEQGILLQQQQQQPPSVLQSVSSSSSSSSSSQRMLQLPPVPVPPPQYSWTDEPLATALIEVLLHKPTIRAPHELEDGYIWQDIVMIASLPHVELEFVVPGKPDKRHKSLFMVDSGAGGAEVMFHSRAARELELLEHTDEQYKGWGEGLAEERTVSGVGSSNGSSSSSNQQPSQVSTPSGSVTSAGVNCLAGKLPELLIRGQAGSDPATQGSLQLKGVRALFNRAGGLDISLYSAGMVCADLLSRMQVVFDYPNKRIGWKVPPPAALAQLQQREQQEQQQ